MKFHGINNNNSRSNQIEKGMTASGEDIGSSDLEIALMTFIRQNSQQTMNEDEWILDSGATRHMAFSQRYFKNYKLFSAEVEVGEKFKRHVMGIGDLVKLSTNVGDKLLLLQGVYQLPMIQFNVFSIRHQLNANKENKIAVHFDQVDTASLIYNGNVVNVRLDPESRLYKLKLERFISSETSAICLSSFINKQI